MAELAYARLAAELAAQIADGTYRPGDRLPSVRGLRSQKKISAATVCRAFEEIERRGLVEARPRSGWYVRAQDAALDSPPMRGRLSAPKKITLHELTDSIVATTGTKGLVPFGGTSLAPSLLPTKLLNRITRTVLRAQPDVLVRYTDPTGVPSLRRAIAKRTGVSAEDVVVTSGCMEAIRLSLMAATEPGDLVAIETPTFFGFLQLVRDLGRRAIEVPVDPATGLDVHLLAEAAAEHRIRALLVTPNFQNPLGALMPVREKKRLVALAARHRFVAIESDVYGDLAHDGTRPPPLAQFDDKGVVMTCSSVSKTLAPGLRVGWVVSPQPALDRVRALKLSGSICSPPLNQHVVADVLSSGAYDRHIARLRPALAAQVAAATRAIERSFGAKTKLTRPTGGYVLWAQMPADVDTAAGYEAALSAGVAFVPGVVCGLGRRHKSALRLSCGHPWSDRLESGIERLAEAITVG